MVVVFVVMVMANLLVNADLIINAVEKIEKLSMLNDYRSRCN